MSVEDAEAAAGRAEALGATVVLPAGDVGDSGRLAVFRDPQGAVLSLWQPGRHFGVGLVNVPGALTWNDLLTPDVEASAAFYRELFGWAVDEIPGAEGQYWSIANGDIRNGGRFAIIRDPHNAVFSVADGEFDPSARDRVSLTV